MINIFGIAENSTSFLMNRESSSTNSFGWNVYGGVGTIYGSASVGYVHSDVYQVRNQVIH